jgi:hypothetical protein
MQPIPAKGDGNFMTLAADLSTRRTDYFLALILDNEVTVGEFVTQPPLPWSRFIQRNGIFQVAEGYPTLLTEIQAKEEMRNWDDVSLEAIVRALPELSNSVDYMLFGNNAGQGFPLAQSLPKHLVADQAAVIYAKSLPQMSGYQNMGYRNFFRRSEATARLVELAKKSKRSLELCFINTIQHNETNYHDP